MSERPVTVAGKSGPVRIERNEHGVPVITASEMADAQLGLGFCHARDRGLQILLVRILGRGQACEHLQDSEDMLLFDRYFRRWNLGADSASEEAALSGPARRVLEAYCAGVNLYFSSRRLPWELRLLGYRFEPWTIADTFLTAKVAGLITLAQSQADIEQFIVECVRQRVDRARLEDLFPGQLGSLDEELLRRVQLPEPLVPESLKWASALPRMVASNNWVVSGAKTASGKPMLCNDPHLEVNRLPAVWCEAVLRWTSQNENRYAVGASFPGLPGISIGRTPDLAWGVTYAFMDCMDSWVEECRDGKYRRGDSWQPFTARKEIIRRRKHPPLELTFYENDHGVLHGDPLQPGHYLATRWSCRDQTSATTFNFACGMPEAKTVAEGQVILGNICNAAWNWVLADRSGNIGYQMSGKMPRRRPGISGLVPVAGWDPDNDWRGFYPLEDLPRTLNPADGFVATANHDLNHYGKAAPINVCMAAYRADRIGMLLARPSPCSIEKMQKLQMDLYSPQAEQFMAFLRPLLPEFSATHSEPVGLLERWDFIYASESKAAFVFEQFYRALLYETFGRPDGAFGESVLERVLNETCIFYDFYGNFDRVLLSEKSSWFGSRSRAEVYRAALAKALAIPPRPYGHTRMVRMRHLLLGGKLPLFLGFDRRLEMPGNRATVHQGQIYRGSGRELSFAPSFRLVTDLASDEIHTTLAGGPSDRRFSNWYANGVRDWIKGQYKLLSGRAFGR